MNAKQLIPVLICASLMLAACGGAEPEAPAQGAADRKAPAKKDAAKQAKKDAAQQAKKDEAKPANLRNLLASEDRSAEDRAHDADRKPAAVIKFLGIERGMRVVDVIAAGGYYTEVLSLAVGPKGNVVAQNPNNVLESRDGANEKAISARLAGKRLPNVSRVNGNLNAVPTEDGLYDAALTALNFHDLYNGRGPDAALATLKAIYGLLKPGGVFGLIDHVGVAGANNTDLHRIEPSLAIATAKAAGFIVEEQSDLLASSADNHTKVVTDDGQRGKTDRFLLRLRKPAN